MHRTEGADYLDLGGGIRRFQDQNLPTTPGTVDTSGYNNAVQEELCRLVELSGGTVAASAVADEAGGWRQVYDRIFESAAITDAGLSDISIDKVTEGNLYWYRDVTGSTEEVQLSWGVLRLSEKISTELYTILLEPNEFRMFTGGTSEFCGFNIVTGMTIRDSDGSQLKATGKGIKYPDGPGNASGHARDHRESVFSMTGITWTNPVSNVYVVTGLTYSTNQTGQPGIPDTVESNVVMDAAIYSDGYCAPCSVKYDEASGYVRITDLSITSPTTPPTAFELRLRYAANSI
jgi:hypothetical protein